jgi:hypothetical protein
VAPALADPVFEVERRLLSRRPRVDSNQIRPGEPSYSHQALVAESVESSPPASHRDSARPSRRRRARGLRDRVEAREEAPARVATQWNCPTTASRSTLRRGGHFRRVAEELRAHQTEGRRRGPLCPALGIPFEEMTPLAPRVSSGTERAKLLMHHRRVKRGAPRPTASTMRRAGDRAAPERSELHPLSPCERAEMDPEVRRRVRQGGADVYTGARGDEFEKNPIGKGSAASTRAKSGAKERPLAPRSRRQLLFERRERCPRATRPLIGYLMGQKTVTRGALSFPRAPGSSGCSH